MLTLCIWSITGLVGYGERYPAQSDAKHAANLEKDAFNKGQRKLTASVEPLKRYGGEED